MGIPRPWPRCAHCAIIYVLAFAMALLACFLACHLSLWELAIWSVKWPVGPLCTFQNFLQGFAMLPQLVVSRKRGFVAPAAGKFLLFIGVKHIVEFLADLWVPFKPLQARKFHTLHELSHMSGDLFAALILLDFLYLFMTSNSWRLLSQLDCFSKASRG